MRQTRYGQHPSLHILDRVSNTGGSGINPRQKLQMFKKRRQQPIFKCWNRKQCWKERHVVVWTCHVASEYFKTTIFPSIVYHSTVTPTWFVRSPVALFPRRRRAARVVEDVSLVVRLDRIDGAFAVDDDLRPLDTVGERRRGRRRRQLLQPLVVVDGAVFIVAPVRHGSTADHSTTIGLTLNRYNPSLSLRRASKYDRSSSRTRRLRAFMVPPTQNTRGKKDNRAIAPGTWNERHDTRAVTSVGTEACKDNKAKTRSKDKNVTHCRFTSQDRSKLRSSCHYEIEMLLLATVNIPNNKPSPFHQLPQAEVWLYGVSKFITADTSRLREGYPTDKIKLEPSSKRSITSVSSDWSLEN